MPFRIALLKENGESYPLKTADITVLHGDVPLIEKERHEIIFEG